MLSSVPNTFTLDASAGCNACWDADRRLTDMDRMGIRTQALSPMPELFNYWMDIDPASDLIRYLNDSIAAMVKASGGRLPGCESVFCWLMS